MARTVVEIRYNHFTDIARRMPGAVGEIVQRTAFEVEAYAKTVVPVDTGALKNSIQTEMESETSATVYTPQDYSVYVNYGTSRQAAQPFMEPAAEAARPGFISALQQLESRLG